MTPGGRGTLGKEAGRPVEAARQRPGGLLRPRPVPHPARGTHGAGARGRGLAPGGTMAAGTVTPLGLRDAVRRAEGSVGLPRGAPGVQGPLRARRLSMGSERGSPKTRRNRAPAPLPWAPSAPPDGQRKDGCLNVRVRVPRFISGVEHLFDSRSYFCFFCELSARRLPQL